MAELMPLLEKGTFCVYPINSLTRRGKKDGSK